MPCDYKQYHPDWKWIRRQILDQADDRCEFCGLDNYAVVTRDPVARPVRIVLTIAHLDHDINNNDPCNLRALCQQCHLRWDVEHHTTNAAETRRMKQAQAGQTSLMGAD